MFMSQSTLIAVDSIRDPAGRLAVEDDVAVVTGAAGGIGRYVAFALASAGADVALVDRDTDDLSAVKKAIDDEVDRATAMVKTDVTDERAVEEMVESVIEKLGGIDILVNVAGVMTMAEPEAMDLDAWNFVVRVNLTGTFLCCRSVFPLLKNGGRIVNISSTAGTYGYRDMVHYGAAKAGIENVTRTLANAWADENIRVNAIAPGLIYTELTAQQYGVDRDRALNRDTVKRSAGAPHEIADTVCFLASPASSFITGETLTVGGPPPDQVDIWTTQ